MSLYIQQERSGSVWLVRWRRTSPAEDVLIVRGVFEKILREATNNVDGLQNAGPTAQDIHQLRQRDVGRTYLEVDEGEEKLRVGKWHECYWHESEYSRRAGEEDGHSGAEYCKRAECRQGAR